MSHKKLAADTIRNLRDLSATDVGFFWYTDAEQYAQFLLIFEDRAAMHDTFAQWHKEAKNRLKQFERRGHKCHKVHTTPQVFLEWCHAKQLPLTAASRSQFATQNLSSKIKAPISLGSSIHNALSSD